MNTRYPPPADLVFYRRAAGFTVEQLAVRADITVDAVRSYEAGRRSPRLDVLKRLAVVLDAPLVRTPRALRERRGTALGGVVEVRQ